MDTKTTVGAAVLLIAVFSVVTGLVVHHNDQINNAHAMMVSSAMEKTKIMKAETSAAMKQKLSDTMVEHGSMMKTSSSTTSMNSKN